MDLAPQVGARERDRKSSAHGPSSPDQITTRLIEGIQAGRYVPGQRLIEADLTAEYGVSRGTVREALSRLAAEGLIHLVPHRGAYIRSLTRTDVNDILLVVERLASLAARLAAEAIGQGRNRADFTRAYEGVVAFRDHIEGLPLAQARTAFYDTLIRIGGNRELARAMPLMHIHLLRMQVQQYMSAEDRAQQFTEYDAVAEHILKGDQRQAEAMMRDHLRRTRLRIERLPDEVFPSLA